VHKVGNKIECNNMHGERINILVLFIYGDGKCEATVTLIDYYMKYIHLVQKSIGDTETCLVSIFLCTKVS